ncbi:MAG: prevent-host-death protein [bacterium]|nr:prevent-host-death protein [bacterium]
MSELEDVQYVSDDRGEVKGVVVPIDLWNEITSELETTYLFQSETMKKRLLEAKHRQDGIPFEEALEKLGI